VSLHTESGESLATATPPKSVQGDGITFSFIELAVPRKHDPARAILRIKLPLGPLPMQAIGAQPRR
jgi:hypothetical protein